jgi:glycosyltransferase involved in cell wall biosynthesis
VFRHGSQLTTTTRIRSPVAGVDLRFSVVICAYTERRWEDIAGAVASIRAQTRLPVRTILVVDHNPSLLARARIAFPELVVVPNSARRGLSGGRNTGVSHAIGDVVAFLDDDARAQPDWLERLGAGYLNPSVVGVGGAVTPVWPGQRPPWLPPEFDWVVGCTFVGMPTMPAPVRNLIGANMSFRREALDAVGGFTDGLGRVGTRPLGCEETELGIRLRQWRTDVQLRYEPAAVVHHRVTSERVAWAYFCSRCYAEGVSKAMVSRLVGTRDALETERRYVRSVLPRAMARGLRPRRRDRAVGITSVGAIMAGLMLTTTGYVRGRLAARQPGAGGAA